MVYVAALIGRSLNSEFSANDLELATLPFISAKFASESAIPGL